MIQTRNERGYRGPQPRGPVRLSGRPWADQRGTEVEWRWTRGIHGTQKGGSGGFRGDNVVDQKDQVHASRELRDKGPHKHGPEE